MEEHHDAVEDGSTKKEVPALNWLEHQARLIGGTVEHCDQLTCTTSRTTCLCTAKAKWGERVLNMRKKAGGAGKKEVEDLNECPWLVWEREEEKHKRMPEDEWGIF